MLEERGFTQYTDENGNTRWKATVALKEWANAENIDLMLKDGSVEMKIEGGARKFVVRTAEQFTMKNLTSVLIVVQVGWVMRKLCRIYYLTSLKMKKF